MLGVGRCRAIYNWCSVRMYVLQIRPQGEGVKRLSWIRRSMVYRSCTREAENRFGGAAGHHSRTSSFSGFIQLPVRNEPVSVVCNIVRHLLREGYKVAYVACKLWPHSLMRNAKKSSLTILYNMKWRKMTQHYLPVHKKESGNFSKIWYKKVHATTCISMHRSTK